MTGANFSGWFNNAEGTFYADSQINVVGGYRTIADIYTLSGIGSQWYYSPSSTVSFNGVSISSINIGLSNRIVGAYNSAGSYETLNNGSVSSNTSVFVPSIAIMSIGINRSGGENLNGYIKKLAYYPLKVSSTQMQALTS
jgi:hypothetical protein